MIRDYTPIPCPEPDRRKSGPRCAPPVLEFARALTQLAFVARTSGEPTPELLHACAGAEALIAKHKIAS